MVCASLPALLVVAHAWLLAVVSAVPSEQTWRGKQPDEAARRGLEEQYVIRVLRPGMEGAGCNLNETEELPRWGASWGECPAECVPTAELLDSPRSSAPPSGATKPSRISTTLPSRMMIVLGPRGASPGLASSVPAWMNFTLAGTLVCAASGVAAASNAIVMAAIRRMALSPVCNNLGRKPGR